MRNALFEKIIKNVNTRELRSTKRDFVKKISKRVVESKRKSNFKKN